jgi:murein tripeptide amidase MpaA
MAEWFVEGLLERLTAQRHTTAAAAGSGDAAVRQQNAAAAAGGAADAEVEQLLQSAVLYIVPNMCPDGSVR